MLTPVLVWPDLDVEAALLEKRLPPRFRRAENHAGRKQDLLALVASALSIKPPPAGPIARLADGLETQEHDWFRAEPVMWLPGRDSFQMMSLENAALEDDEAESLIEVARAHFGSQLLMECGNSGRWYVALENVSAVHTEALSVAMEQAITPLSLGEGADAGRLRAFLNELQMLWYEHPVNVARRKTGQPEVNALWMWGCGRLPTAPNLAKMPRLRTDEPLIITLAQWLKLECEPLSGAATMRSMENLLVVIGQGEEARGEVWLEAFASIRGAWRLYAADSEWRIPARGAWFFWQGW